MSRERPARSPQAAVLKLVGTLLATVSDLLDREERSTAKEQMMAAATDEEMRRADHGEIVDTTLGTRASSLTGGMPRPAEHQRELGTPDDRPSRAFCPGRPPDKKGEAERCGRALMRRGASSGKLCHKRRVIKWACLLT